MLSPDDKIQDLAPQERRRQSLETVVPQLRGIFGADFAESNLKILDPESFHEGLSRSWTGDVHYIWNFDDRDGIEAFCGAFAREIGDVNVKIFIPQLETGELDINLAAALAKAFAFLEAFGSLWLYEPQSAAEFEISKHTYHQYGDAGEVPEEHKWELGVRGAWAEIARRQLNDG